MAKEVKDVFKDIDKKIEELNQETYMLQAYKEIREKAIENMQWNGCDYHAADEEHDQTWFSEPDPSDEYKYPKYEAYKKLIEIMDNAVLGGKR